MITNKGREIVGKYLLGQTSSYASYLAIGCGAKPLTGGVQPDSDKTRDALEFEMVRVPIIAKGFVSDIINDETVTKLILKAELPTEQRFRITEIGIYPAARNERVGQADSKIVANFLPSEEWQYIDNSSAQTVNSYAARLDPASDGDILLDGGFSPQDAFFATDENAVWDNLARKNRFEAPRFYNRSLFVIGDSATATGTVGSFTVGGNPIKNTTMRLDLSKNNPTDKIKLAASLVPVDSDNSNTPAQTRIIIDFLNEYPGTDAYARWEIEKTSWDDYYFVEETTLSDMSIVENSGNFSWASINGIRIYTATYSSGVPSANWYICYDGLRLENLSAVNPLYGLVGYNVVVTDDGQPIIKRANTSNYVEYRFGIGVL